MAGLKASKELLDLMNEAIAREIQVSVQYLWQHVQWAGVTGFAVKDELKKIAIAEMKHAEKIAERLVALGGRPTTKPSPILVGETLKEMLKTDRKDEEGAIVLYRKIVALARKDGDGVTERLFQEILADEEDHYSTFDGLLQGM
ncbi:MAG: ferritin-like domain-containing protein [Gemmatimonadota bacterium]